MLSDDGDIVRGLGFVALYAAYLEEQIDNLLFALEQIEAKKQRQPISEKIKHATAIIGKLDSSEFPDFAADLQTCLGLFKYRNEIIHGRIYANFDRPDTIKSGRPSNPDQEIHSQELYKLANELDEFRSVIYAQLIFKIPRAVDKYIKV
jgi:hypothetical protein